MARLLSSGPTSSITGKMLPNRRAKSLDSIVIVDSEPPSPRCPSPTPSSGVDSNKDSPIQIENIDGSSIGMYFPSHYMLSTLNIHFCLLEYSKVFIKQILDLYFISQDSITFFTLLQDRS